MKTLIKFKQFIDELKLDNGRNYKISVLEKYKFDSDIKYYLNFICNPFIVTGLSNKKLSKAFDNLKDYIPENYTIKELLEYIQTNNTGTDENIKHCQVILSRIENNDLKELLFLILTKNLPIGIDAKTINKVIPNLIPQFSVMLANRYFDKPEIVEGKEFAITTKIDGSRIIAIKENGKIKFFTRQGQHYEGLVDLEEELKNVNKDNFVLDGELVAINTSKEETYKNTTNLASTKEHNKHGLRMLVFDYLELNEFKTQNCITKYIDRRNKLNEIFENNKLEYFFKLPLLYQGTDTSKIIELLNSETSKGEEGIMINLTNSFYEFKRTNVLLKVKKFLDTEVKVIGFEPGINKYENTLGSLICEYKGNTLNVGSGISDELRDYIWTHQDEYLNKFITVKYFEESYNSTTGIPSLRFPVFIRKREL